MLFMVIETFRHGPGAVRERFFAEGRLMPEGLRYVASWIENGGGRCFQIIEADDPARIPEWTSRWADLIDFEIVPVLTSAAYWAAFTG